MLGFLFVDEADFTRRGRRELDDAGREVVRRVVRRAGGARALGDRRDPGGAARGAGRRARAQAAQRLRAGAGRGDRAPGLARRCSSPSSCSGRDALARPALRAADGRRRDGPMTEQPRPEPSCGYHLRSTGCCARPPGAWRPIAGTSSLLVAGGRRRAAVRGSCRSRCGSSPRGARRWRAWTALLDLDDPTPGGAGLPQPRAGLGDPGRRGCWSATLHGVRPRLAGVGGAADPVALVRDLPGARAAGAGRHAGGRRRSCPWSSRATSMSGDLNDVHADHARLRCSSCCCSPRCRRRGRSTPSAATSRRPSAGSSGTGWPAVLVPGAAVRAGPRRPERAGLRRPASPSASWPGLLVILTGGLEAGIAMHVLNNFLAFGVALAFSDMDRHAQPHRRQLVEPAGHPDPVARSTSALALLVARRMGLAPDVARRPAVLVASAGSACKVSPGSWGLVAVANRAEPGWDPVGYGVIGNTTGSGPVILGSSPSIPARSRPAGPRFGARRQPWLESQVRVPQVAQHESVHAPVV